MTMRAKIKLFSALLVVAGAYVTAACEPAAPPVTPPPPTPSTQKTAPTAHADADSSFRKKPPQSGPEAPFVPPAIQEAKLSSGVRVLLVERHDLPIVALSISVDRGAELLPPGVGGFLGAMLMQGTKTRSALQISDDLEQLGAWYSAGVGYDSAQISARIVANRLPAALDVIADIVKNPAFPKAEVDRVRSLRLTSIAQQNDQPRAVLSNTLAAALYPNEHPYHTSLLGLEEQVKKISSADLKKAYEAIFSPAHTTIAVAGDITKERAVAELEHAFGDWKIKPGEAKARAWPELSRPGANEPRVVLVDKPGSTQSFVAVAQPGVPRKVADFDALLVMNTLLGGQFSSRLNMNLREKHAYTYGASSRFDFRHAPGPFSAGGAIVREHTGPAIREILSEIRAMRSALVAEDELADAKANLVRELPARFESTNETASSLAALAVYGLPLDEFATRPARIEKVTRDDVRRVAEKYLDPDAMRIIVVGDAAAVKAQLADLGLGELRIEEAKGDKTASKPAKK